MEIDPDAWAGFIAMRRAKGQRAPWTPRAEKLLLGKLQAAHAEGWDVNHMLDEACERGWSSCFVFQGCRRIVAEKPAINPSVAAAAEQLARQAEHIPADKARVAEIVGRLNLRRVA